MSYEGWTNWNTWNVNLWFDNEEPLYKAKRRFMFNHGRYGIKAEHLEQVARAIFPRGTPDMEQGASELDAVNWQEIADAWQVEFDEDIRPKIPPEGEGDRLDVGG